MNPEEEKLWKDYEVTADHFRMLAESRFKLLAFIPALTATAVAVLSTATHPLAGLLVGLVGLAVSLGVVIYDLRNTQLYDHANRRAKCLEVILKLPSLADGADYGGLFFDRPKRREDKKLFGRIKIWHDRGLAIVYGTVVGAWCFLILFSMFRLLLPMLGDWPAAVCLPAALLLGWLFYKEHESFDNYTDDHEKGPAKERDILANR